MEHFVNGHRSQEREEPVASSTALGWLQGGFQNFSCRPSKHQEPKYLLKKEKSPKR